MTPRDVEPELIITFIKIAWNSWIKSLNIGQNNLSKIFKWDVDFFSDFIDSIWNSWLIVVNLSFNQLSKFYENSDIKQKIENLKSKWIHIFTDE